MNRIVVVAMLSVTLLLGGCAGWKKKRADRARAAEEKRQAEASATPQNDFEKSGDPPFTAQTRFAAGQLAESQGALDNAITQYQAALKLDPNHIQAMFRLGGLQSQTRRYTDAVATWQRYIKVTNHAPAAYNNLALSYDMAGRPDEAEKAFKDGIARAPEDPTCRVNYGLMLARRNRLDDAVAQLSTVLAPAEVHYNLGSLFEQMGRRKEARAYYQKALELDPKLTDAKKALAQLK